MRPSAALAALVVSACVTRRVQPREAPVIGSPQAVESLVRLALTLDAAGDRSADTLYAPDAIVVGNARMRLAAPRFAGITSGVGRVTITAASATVSGRFAWVLVDYRWINPADRSRGGAVEAGRATFICEQRGERWKIVHVHSSQPLPWER
jgi:ketosteroid isomerase-like protein